MFSLFEIVLSFSLLLGVARAAQGESTMVVEKEQALLSEDALRKLDSWIRRLDLKARIKFDVLTPEYYAGAIWERRVEASYIMGNTTLVDDYTLQARYNPTESSYLLDTNAKGDSTLGLGGNGLLRIMFERQFAGAGSRDYAKVLTTPPYTPLTFLPMTAERITSKMAVNDFMQIQGVLNLVLSASQIKMFTPELFVNVGAQYILSGEFQVHLYRLSQDKFSLKIIGIRGRDAAGFLRLGVNPLPDFKLTSVEMMDKMIRRRLVHSPFDITLTFPDSNLFLVDYIIDMSKPQVRDAFDEVMRGIWSVKTIKYLDPSKSRTETENLVLADARPLEKIFESENVKGAENREVDRMFRGSNDILKGSGLKITLGQRDVGQFNWSQSYTENFIKSEDRFNTERYFYMPIYLIASGHRLGFGYIDERTVTSASMLFETNYKKEIQSLGEMSFYLEHTDKKFSPGEIRKYKDAIRKRIPKSIYDRIKWKDWADGKARSNARLTSLLVFKPQALMYAAGIDIGQMRERFINYAKSFDEIDANPDRGLDGNSDPTFANSSRKFEDRFLEDLNYISYHLAIVMNSGEKGRKRADSFISLRTNPLWAELGGGFLVSLLEEEARKHNPENGAEDLLNNIYYETVWTAKNSDTVHEVFGPCGNRRLYRAIMYIYSVMSSRGMGMRAIDNNYIPGVPDSSKATGCEN